MFAAALGRSAAKAAAEKDSSVVRRLWQVYSSSVRPLEERSGFHHFHLPPLTAEELEARPQVLFLGQYSTGKTSMIRWLTGVDSPHFDIRPQPSTDKFVAIVHGDQERLINGNAATCLPQLPYQGLSRFGGSFLSNFQALVEPVPLLQEFSIVDTPGVLSGSKQTAGRDYDFTAVCRWLADRSDLILLMFDAHKLDPSDELKGVIQSLRPHRDKVRCVLNKADQIDAENLVRVYGALLWNVGQILRTPEVARVYISSFWDQPYQYDYHKRLFDEDKENLMLELHALPRTAIVRKINQMISRIRLVRAHLCIVGHLRSQLRRSRVREFFGGGSERQLRDLSECLPRLFEEAQKLRGLSAGDMPDVVAFRERLLTLENTSLLLPWDQAGIDMLDRVTSVEMPKLMASVGGVTASELSTKEPEVPPQQRTWPLSLFGGRQDVGVGPL
mmetsp:Transcript_69831/g.194158  ORF Transcript_69831/g.194158 Transcript_69831/m.194158 type:complete len:444 (-) Transcript_69831:104-1435(-)